MSAPEHVRHEWEESARRLESSAGDPQRYRALLEQMDAVTGELRKRVGQTYSLAELARSYDGAEEWVRDIVVYALPPRARAGIRDATLVQDAAFAHYARGATDFVP